MKPFHLNLASRPYRDYRPVYVVAGILAVLSAILITYNVQTAYRYFVNTKQTRERIAQLDTATANEQATGRRIQAETARFDFRTLRDASHSINVEIAERTFSWSSLLDRLERVVPNDVRLTRLNPTIDEKSGNVVLSLECAAKSRSGMVRFLDNLFRDAHFASPFPLNETSFPGGGIAFSIEVNYLPEAGGVVK